MDEQERLARDLAETLVDTHETNVTHAQVRAWRVWDVYEWLEAWDYAWDGSSWKQETTQ